MREVILKITLMENINISNKEGMEWEREKVKGKTIYKQEKKLLK